MLIKKSNNNRHTYVRTHTRCIHGQNSFNATPLISQHTHSNTQRSVWEWTIMREKLLYAINDLSGKYNTTMMMTTTGLEIEINFICGSHSLVCSITMLIFQFHTRQRQRIVQHSIRRKHYIHVYKPKSNEHKQQQKEWNEAWKFRQGNKKWNNRSFFVSQSQLKSIFGSILFTLPKRFFIRHIFYCAHKNHFWISSGGWPWR